MNAFNPNDHLMQIKNRNGSNDYLPVAWRLVWFREQCLEGSIETEMLHLDLDRETEEEGYAWNQETRRSEKIVKRANGLAVFRATVKDGKGGMSSGTKSEKAASFPDFIEKAETGAIGRALAALGYGTQFAPDLDEGHRIVDSPIEQQRHPAQPVATTVEDGLNEAPASDQQIAALRKLYQHLGQPDDIAEDLRYLEAKAIIENLSRQYKEQRQKKTEPEEETPTIKDLQKRCNALFGVGFWQAMVLKALKVENMDIVLKDTDLTPQDRLAFKKYMDFAEEKRAS